MTSVPSGSKVLHASEATTQRLLAAHCHLGTKNVNFQMTKYVAKRRADGTNIINLHKTCSTPHGGGGPGSGPVVFSAALARFAPPPYVQHRDGSFTLVEDSAPGAAGRMSAFHGQFGTFGGSSSFSNSRSVSGFASTTGIRVPVFLSFTSNTGSSTPQTYLKKKATAFNACFWVE